MEAEDIVQTAFEKALRLYYNWDASIKPFDRWFSSVLFNAKRQWLKEKRAGGLIYDIDDFEIPFEEELKPEVAGFKKLMYESGYGQLYKAYYESGYTLAEYEAATGHKVTAANQLTRFYAKKYRDMMEEHHGGVGIRH